MKTALVHDWLVDLGGAEKCVSSFLNIFPADVFTLLYRPETLRTMHIPQEKVQASFIQHMPLSTRMYRNYLAWFPRAIESFDVSGYDLVISSSHSVAKGVLTHAGQLHISYCYTPVRYAWDLYHQYLQLSGLTRGIKGWYAKRVLERIRQWDLTASNRADHLVAISRYIQNRIRHVYRRESDVIYPPVDVEDFTLTQDKEDFYLCASRMVPYKKMDLVAAAFKNIPDKKLRIIGTGPEWKKVQAAALNAPNIELLGYQPFPVLRENMQKAKGFVFAAEEDFGIIPVEAQACGTPVIAFGKGGARETVLENKTGVFFPEQTLDAVVQAVRDFEKKEDKWNYSAIRRHAAGFSRTRFESEFKALAEQKYLEHKKHL